MYKWVHLEITCPVSPTELVVSTCHGTVIQRLVVNQTHFSICFCTNECCIKIVAKHEQQTIYQTLYLDSVQCQCVPVNIVFSTVSSSMIYNKILLFDANYDFPVASALLNFALV